MPAKQKRALQEADPNAETRTASTGNGNKKQKQKENQPPMPDDDSNAAAAADQDKNASEGHTHDEETPIDKLPPYEYILMDRPMYDFRNEARARARGELNDDHASDNSEADDYDDEDALDEKLADKWKAAQDANLFGKLASTKPEHKWISMRGTWIQLAEAVRHASYRSPDSFGMYIYNDFEGYGIHELVENFLVRYNKEFTKKEADQSIEEMWSTISGFIHWANQDRSFDIFNHIDDGERVDECWQVLATAYLSMLNTLERAKQLGPDSKIKDLGLVTALFLNLHDFWVDFDSDFQLDILRFLQDHEIDVTSSGVSGLDQYIAEQQEQLADHPEPPKAGVDRYGFKAAWKAHTRNYGKGGNRYDITRMTRAERKKHAFDGQDPLAEFSEKDIKSGMLLLG